MTPSRNLRNGSRMAILVLAAVLTTGFVINQPVLAANNGNGNNGNGNLIANSQSVSVDENSSVAITLTGSGPSGFTYMISSGPMHGTLTGTAPNMTYIPTTDYVGADSFTFYTHKGGNDSTAASVNITINEVVVNPSPPVTCDEGFHVEGDVCAPDIVDETPVLTCGEGFHTENNVCVPDVVEEQPEVLTCDEGFHVEGEACIADDEQTEEDNTEDENEGSDDEQQSITTTSSASGKNRSLVMAAAVSLMELDGAIPESTTGLGLYDAIIGPSGINLLSAMKAVTAADMDWNGLTEAQQVWVIENFNELLN